MSERLSHSLELIYLLVQKELKVRYKNSVLGYLWALANPCAFATVYYIAFKIVMRLDMPNYGIFLLTGLFPWVWLTNSLVQATSSYCNNATLVKKVQLERAVLPLSSVLHEMVHFCLALPVLWGFMLVAGLGWHLSWVWQVPLMMLLQLALVYPVALMFALTNVFVRDVEYIVGLGMSMMFFLTPVVYPVSLVPEVYRPLFAASPLAALIGNWRSVLLEGRIEFVPFVYCLVLAGVLIVAARGVYRRAAGRIGELL